jgi:hypothetical protein
MEIFVLAYEDEQMRPVEIIPEWMWGRLRRIMKWVNSAIIYCKNFCKCHSGSPAQVLRKIN